MADPNSSRPPQVRPAVAVLVVARGGGRAAAERRDDAPAAAHSIPTAAPPLRRGQRASGLGDQGERLGELCVRIVM